MDAGPYGPARPGRVQALALDHHRRVARVHRGARRGGEAAVTRLAHDAQVTLAEIDGGIAVRGSEVADLGAEPVLDLPLGTGDLPARGVVAGVRQPRVGDGVRAEVVPGRGQLTAVLPG